MAAEVIGESRIQLMLKFRFLDLALWRMEAQPVAVQGRYALATDGRELFFEPYTVTARFEESFDEVVRDYLHLVMHCIFRHPFDEGHKRHEAWWLACDVVAESTCLEMCGSRFPSDLDSDRRAALSELRLMCGQLTPPRLYALFERSLTAPDGSTYQMVSQTKMSELTALFERDNHEAWPSFAKAQTSEEPGDVQDLGTPDDNADESAPDDADKETLVDGEAPAENDERQEIRNPEAANSSEDADQEAQGTADDAQDVGDSSESTDAGQSIESDERASSTSQDDDREVEDEKSQEEREWEEIAKQIETSLETFSREWGDEAGSLMANLTFANRKRYDYGDFLRRFCALSEEMRVNDDEFDYIFYTYGLELYGNMPLIEPLEYKETQRIRDFVICIDTSESCRGDLVRSFVEHTFSVMKGTQDFAHEVNVRIVQCDARVQADTKVTDLRDVDAFMDGFYIRGMGGTDFRPAFAYVDTLRDRGELADMKGLIYFTDGLGTFPEAAPDYEVAFVFMDNGEPHLPSVPPWAMRVTLDEEGISRLEKTR